MDSILIPIALAFVAGYYVSLWRQNYVTRKSLLPPGPPGSLIWGNYYDMPSSQQWLKYTQWAKEYGACVRHWHMPLF
ncbi:hypothetical protein NM688_g5602 [Phlebia brevispora]|uniref:Uncharacterized protein n=1 Tax=Phlebia brevispora TaxID=194682 RepID=A0ACC1SSK2_9APHY|nr:hypothetical protein NM688_g5602 [Phlebia brevispora]